VGWYGLIVANSNDEKKPDGNHGPLNELVSWGSSMTGSVVGTGLGFLIGGPAGAVLGAAGGPTVASILQKAAGDVLQRHLSGREKTRIGAVSAYAAERIGERLKAGEGIRGDGFFEANVHERAAAEEIFEGIIRAAQKETEEKKIPSIGRLFASLAFDSRVDRAHANVLIRLAEDLSYRQLCLLAIFAQPLKYLDVIYQHSKVNDVELAGLVEEIRDLFSRRMIIQTNRLGEISPRLIRLRTMSAELYRLMELGSADETDLENLAKPLRTFLQPTSGPSTYDR